jgi:hypothetical protein
MPLKLFKGPAEKAEIEFNGAYLKGVNLGPQKWPEAVQHFNEASKQFALAGDVQKASESAALASLFYALTNQTQQAWDSCGQAMARIPTTRLNVGFNVSADDLAQQCSVLSYDMVSMQMLDGNSKDVSRAADLRTLAQKYMELVGNDLALWRLLKVEIDPQRRAFYLLGLSSLIEANSLVDSDPKKSVALFSEAATNLELSGMDPMAVVPGAQAKLENISKFGQCWFCGREMQGQGFHFILLPANVSSFTQAKYSGTTPHVIEANAVVACESCASSIRNVADEVARIWYDRAIGELRAAEERINARISNVERRLGAVTART